MEVTDVRIFLSSREGPTKAYANLTLDDSFVVRSIKVVQGKNGFFVSMPARRLSEGKFQDICFPITAELRKTIQKKVMDTYNKVSA